MLLFTKTVSEEFEYELEKLEDNEFLIEYKVHGTRYVMSFMYIRQEVSKKHIENIDQLSMDEIANAHLYFNMLKTEIVSICELMRKL